MCKTPIKNAGYGEDCRVFPPNWTFFSEDLPPKKKNDSPYQQFHLNSTLTFCPENRICERFATKEE